LPRRRLHAGIPDRPDGADGCPYPRRVPGAATPAVPAEDQPRRGGCASHDHAGGCRMTDPPLYLSLSEIKADAHVTDSDRDGALTRALAAASRSIDMTTGRRFYLDDQ